MKPILRIIAYPFMAVFALILDIICKFFLNWIVVLFCDEEGNLPKCLYWFQTFDNTCYAGQYCRQSEIAARLGGDTWIDFIPYPTTAWQRYLNRGKWLFRNTAYGFDYYLFGLEFIPSNWKCVKWVRTDTLELEIHVGDGFNIKYLGYLGSYKFGWKASNMYDSNSNTYPGIWGDLNRIPLAFSINPFKRK